MPEIVIEARNASIAPGMDVKRILPFRLRRMVGPFIFMDHAGPIADLPVPVAEMEGTARWIGRPFWQFDQRDELFVCRGWQGEFSKFAVSCCFVYFRPWVV